MAGMSRDRPAARIRESATNLFVTNVFVSLFACLREPRVRATARRRHVLRPRRPKGFLGHRETGGSLHIYTALRIAEDWLSTLDFNDTESAKSALLRQFTDWAPELRGLITDADGPLIPRLIHALPVGHRWRRVPGVTLLGDAAHLMSPFAERAPTSP